MKLDKTDLGIIAGLVGVALTYRWLVKSHKGVEVKSNFIGSPLGKRVMFTLTNTTDKPQVVPLFNAYSNIQNPSVTINPSISEFNRTLSNEPKTVKMIEVRAVGNQTQAQQVIQINCKDASGEFKSTNLYPLVSVFQKALDMTSVQPNNLTLTGECYLNYTVLPKQTVILTVHYDIASTPKTEFSNSQRGTSPHERGTKSNERTTTTDTDLDKALEGVKDTGIVTPVKVVKASTVPPPKKVNWKKRALIGAGIVGALYVGGKLIKGTPAPTV